MIHLTRVAISLRPLFSFGWRMLLTLTVCRSVFVVWQWQRVVEVDMLVSIYSRGLRFDLTVLGLMLTVPIILYPLLASNRFLVPAWGGLLRTCLPVVLLAVALIACATPSFVDQLDGRPHILFLEYLNRPYDVAATLWANYRIPILASLTVVAASTWFHSKQISRLVNSIKPVGVLPAILVTPVLLFICASIINVGADQPGLAGIAQADAALAMRSPQFVMAE